MTVTEVGDEDDEAKEGGPGGLPSIKKGYFGGASLRSVSKVLASPGAAWMAWTLGEGGDCSGRDSEWCRCGCSGLVLRS
jgi:hypothetical protein